MNSARCLLGIGLLAAVTHVQAFDWGENQINNVVDQVKSIFDLVKGDIKDSAQDLIDQKNKRTQGVKDNVDDILSFIENRKTPLQDFVNGGAGRCGTGSPCARFRTDLRTFALQMAELKDRFPVLQQHGLGDTDFFAELVNVVPPFVLFGLHEILERIPGWQDLPVDLADIFDEIGDAEAFATTVQVSAQAVNMKTALATSPPRITEAQGDFETFCSKGKELLLDEVKYNRLKGQVTRWKNRFDSFSEYTSDSATISLVGMGLGNLKLPTKPFLKTVSNALDSVHDLMETYRDNLAECGKVEADLAGCAPLVEYRTVRGARKAYFVFVGVLNRSSLSTVDKASAHTAKDQARRKYYDGKYKEAYLILCNAYIAL